MPYALAVENISKSFRLKNGTELAALNAVSFQLPPGKAIALVGPDGAGKTTLLRILAGLLRPDCGHVIFNGEEFDGKNEKLQAQIGYMPQKFGLYEDLTVQENLDLYADLKGVELATRAQRYGELLAMAGLEPFRQRLAGKLSGGMKQKLGLICTLVSPPKLLLLDEPTVGVDPLSRRELWEIVKKLSSASGMSVVLSTSYFDEADRCDEVALLFEGKTLAQGSPESIKRHTENLSYLARPCGTGKTGGKGKESEKETPRALQARLLDSPGIIDAVPQGGAVRFIRAPLPANECCLPPSLLNGATVSAAPASLEGSFMLLLRSGAHHPAPGLWARAAATPNNTASGKATAQPATAQPFAAQPAVPALPRQDAKTPIIQTQNVSRFFGNFIAVNNVSFSVYPGEVFGLLGPNGAGKTTTFRMLCGLLAPSRGNLLVAGVDVRKARAKARRHLGYVAQKFSLYGPLSVLENLDFFAGAYALPRQRKKQRIQAMVEEFSLEQYLHLPAHSLPGGYRQRLAMAVGLLHEPAILFLDEPTSGADPLARRDFWKRISRLAEQGVTIVVTTHFMEEAEYCDKILIQDNGVMLALGRPAEIRALANRQPGREATMEDAFIDIVDKARQAKREQTA